MADKKPKAATKAQIYQDLAEATGLNRKQVASVFDALFDVVKREMGKKGPGIFTIPNLVKLTLKKQKATPERQGVNPFTKEPMTIKAKPARNVVRARPLKNLKEAAK